MGEDGPRQQIGAEPLDLAEARERYVIAEREKLLGARGSRKPRLVDVKGDQRMGILDRGAISKIGCWQVHRVPGPLIWTFLLSRRPHRAVSSRDERVSKVNRKPIVR